MPLQVYKDSSQHFIKHNDPPSFIHRQNLQAIYFRIPKTKPMLIDYFSASFFLMCAMAFPGFRCFGQTLVQFIIV